MSIRLNPLSSQDIANIKQSSPNHYPWKVIIHKDRWAIVNVENWHIKMIEPANFKHSTRTRSTRINYYDRAYDEMCKRNELDHQKRRL